MTDKEKLEELKTAVTDSFNLCIDKYWKVVFKNHEASKEEITECDEANKLYEIAQNDLQKFKKELDEKYFGKN
jgi:hypothetical protein